MENIVLSSLFNEMTEAINTLKLGCKRVGTPTRKLKKKASLSGSFRTSSDLRVMGSPMTRKPKKRKEGLHVRNGVKQASQNPSQSLEIALKGRVLGEGQIKKKEMLERFISRGDGYSVRIAQYLHENGFSYDSQASMVSLKSVNKYLINYLVALFFEESENPLIESRLDMKKIRRISGKWCVIQDIMKKTDLKITAEEVVSRFLKQKGFAYEGLIIFLDLFENRGEGVGPNLVEEMGCPNYKDLKYPFSETQFMRDVLEIAKGGYFGLGGFVELFKKPSSDVESEWEMVKALVWESPYGEPNISEWVFLDYVRKCLKVNGGLSNKQAFMSCLMEADFDLYGEKVSLLEFLRSEIGGRLSTYDAIHVLAKCIGHDGGAKNKQAFVECLSQDEIDLDGKKVSLYAFLISKKGIGLNSFDAIQVIARCIGNDGGAKIKQVLIDFFCDINLGLAGERLSLFGFLISKNGGDLSATEAMQLIVKCICADGGAKNYNAFVECLIKINHDMPLKNETIYSFLRSERGGGLSAVEAIKVLVKIVGIVGGSKNKQAFMECLIKPEIEVDGQWMSLYTFLCSKQGGRFLSTEALRVLSRCIGQYGGSKNKQSLIECFTKLKMDLNGEKVTLCTFLCSKKSGESGMSEAIQTIVRCIGRGGGSRNKLILGECFSKLDMNLDEKRVSLFTLLISKDGCNLTEFEAIQVLEKCIGHISGAKNVQALKEYFNVKILEVDGCKRSLYDLFLSAKMNRREAFSLCLIFSVNLSALNIKDILNLFVVKKEGKLNSSIISLFNGLDIPCYALILKFITKVLSYPNITLESKRALFATYCQSLVDMFSDSNGFFSDKKQLHPNWFVPSLAEACIDACSLYMGKDIHHELNTREACVVDWICQFDSSYQLTKKSLNIVTHVHCLDELKLLIRLCNKEIEKGRIKKVNVVDYCENCLEASLKVLRCSKTAVHAILKYESIILNWFDLIGLSEWLTVKMKRVIIDKSIHYFFENMEWIVSLTPQQNLKKSFIIYIGLSNLTPRLELPLKKEKLQQFFENVGKEFGVEMFEKEQVNIYLLYALYNGLDRQGMKEQFNEVIEGIPKMFASYIQFQYDYQYRVYNKDWLLLIRILQAWDLKKENLTQEGLSFLIRIRYQFPKSMPMAWSEFSRLENCEKGCGVLNKTVYPNWVFALTYLQKVRAYLTEKYTVFEQREEVVFDCLREGDKSSYRFPLFKIELYERGFIFQGQSVKSVEDFYEKFKLSEFLTGADKIDAGVNTKRSGNELTGEGGETKSRKREGSDIEIELPQSQKIKWVTRQDVCRLDGAVSNQDGFNDTHDALTVRKRDYSDVGSPEDRLFVCKTRKKENPMFSELDEECLSLIPEFEDDETGCLSPILFDSFCDDLCQDSKIESGVLLF